MTAIVDYGVGNLSQCIRSPQDLNKGWNMSFFGCLTESNL